MNAPAMLWRRLDQPGHEAARLFVQEAKWHLTGTAVFASEQQPCRLDYLVKCDSAWGTLSGRVTGWVGSAMVDIEVSVDADRRWYLNAKEQTQVEGCMDLDLNFSPSTNLLPIRRLDLLVGQEAMVRAAWLRFPSFELELLDQLYRRIDESTYMYESGGGTFVRQLEVDPSGFVISYPGIWQIEELSKRT
jgi:uncharacterized protein